MKNLGRPGCSVSRPPERELVPEFAASPANSEAWPNHDQNISRWWGLLSCVVKYWLVPKLEILISPPRKKKHPQIYGQYNGEHHDLPVDLGVSMFTNPYGSDEPWFKNSYLWPRVGCTYAHVMLDMFLKHETSWNCQRLEWHKRWSEGISGQWSHQPKVILVSKIWCTNHIVNTHI